MTRIEDNENSYRSDVKCKIQTEGFFKVSANKTVSVPFDLSSSESGITPMEYSIEDPHPSWIQINKTTGLISADTSQAILGLNYKFNVLTTTPPSTWTHSIEAYISVVE